MQKKIKARILLKGTLNVITAAKRLRRKTNPKSQFTKIRVLPESYNIVGGFDVYNQKVIFYSFEEKNISIVIESKIISTLMRTTFEILWNIAEKYDNTLLRDSYL